MAAKAIGIGRGSCSARPRRRRSPSQRRPKMALFRRHTFERSC